jgi:transcriptional regulator GlxA family with amidase domain
LVAEAEALMGSRPWGALTMSGLCRELEVSERSLHYAFRDVLGQTPMAYYRHKRLNAVRRLLKQAGSLQTTVAEVGRAWGFWHTGQFAADYRRLFGEIPSTTLAAACQEEWPTGRDDEEGQGPRTQGLVRPYFNFPKNASNAWLNLSGCSMLTM